ncbi:MAG: NADH-quinone oxidoreductase subunit F [Deltaproteobacteria bacterium]|nr:NADH-quinone oxidoreductase subunit F [Deltaproteobacteria bacterium]
MVDPIYLIVIALGAAFSLGLFRFAGYALRAALTLTAIGAMTFISAQWTYGLVFGTQEPFAILTAGLNPPLSINLLMGTNEAVLTLIVNFAGLLSTLALCRSVARICAYTPVFILVFLLGLNGVILTRDIFNMFVFIEVINIALAGLIILNNTTEQLSSGFKYILASSLAGGFMLLGIVFNYYETGSLNIDVIAQSHTGALTAAGMLGMFLVFISMIIEMKPFPANGWGIDVYESAPPAVSAMVASGTATAFFYALVKILTISGDAFIVSAGVIGAITFIGSNIVALKQTNAPRLMGYSSIGQMGLILLVYSVMKQLELPNIEFIIFGLLVTHAFAKAGLFWLSGLFEDQKLENWALIRKSPVALILMIVFIFALIGFPPFPSFHAKWDLIMQLGSSKAFSLIALILIGSMIEAVYLFRWLGFALKLDYNSDDKINKLSTIIISPFISAILLLGLGYYIGFTRGFVYQSFVIILGFLLIDFLDSKIKNTLAIIVVSAYTYLVYPPMFGDLFRTVFGGIFYIGGILVLFSGYFYKGKRRGFYPSVLSMLFGLFMLVEAKTLFQFFYGWEFMAIGSYFLLIRGKKSMPHGYSYLMFSIGGSLAMLAGFSMAYASSGSIEITKALYHINVYPMIAYSLMLIGFMTKTASIGFHTWLPGAHGEAIADIHFMASAILLKSGVFGIILVLLGMDRSAEYSTVIFFGLLWIGILSALIANINAAFQESAKRLLAWSSIGQLGYILFGLATMTHLGWVVALSLSITHFLYKGILFLVVGGISLKLNTPLMYKMGGLIKRMPFSFFAVLIAIITLSGVPPLIGYTGKWIMYNVSIGQGFYFEGVVISIAGMIAFLYLFRLIHSIFLGQLKDEHSRIGEISIWFLIPVYILLVYIIIVSFAPKVLLGPLGEGLNQYFTSDLLTWDGGIGISKLGHFNGPLIMYVFMGIAATAFGILFLNNRNTQKVKQFNIVYAAERPARPETTHFAYNFFAPYRRALGIFEYPAVTNFWAWMGDIIYSTSGFVRRVYTGNGQTYLIQLMMFMLIVFFAVFGGK